MESLTLEELKCLLDWYGCMARHYKYDTTDRLVMEGKLVSKIKQAIADKEFEEKTRPLNF